MQFALECPRLASGLLLLLMGSALPGLSNQKQQRTALFSDKEQKQELVPQVVGFSMWLY